MAYPAMDTSQWTIANNYFVAENTGSVLIATININAYTIIGIDAAQSDTLTSETASAPEFVGDQMFILDGNLLKLSPNARAIKDETYTVTVMGLLIGGLSPVSTSVTVAGVGNEPPTNVSLDTLSVVEGVDGDTVGVLSATDPDLLDTHTFAVVTDQSVLPSGTTLGADHAKFEIATQVVNAGTATESTQHTLKMKAGHSGEFGTTENPTTYQVTVQVTDSDHFGSGNTPKSFYKTFTVTVVNANNDPEIANIPVSNPQIFEQQEGAEIATLSISDLDLTQAIANETHTWSLESGTTLIPAGETDAGEVMFEIVEEVLHSGTPQETSVFKLKLKDNVSAKHVNGATIQAVVRLTDQAGAYDEQTITVTVINVNDLPTIAIVAFNVDEGDTAVGTVNVGDVDAGQTHAVSVETDAAALPAGMTLGADHAKFEIAPGGSTADGFTLQFAGAHRAAPATSYEVTLKVVSSGNPTDPVANNTLYENITITSRNINNAPTDIALSANTVVEYFAGATIGNLSAVDPELWDRVTMEIVTETGTDHAKFELAATQHVAAKPAGSDFADKDAAVAAARAIRAQTGIPNLAADTATFNALPEMNNAADIDQTAFRALQVDGFTAYTLKLKAAEHAVYDANNSTLSVTIRATDSNSLALPDGSAQTYDETLSITVKEIALSGNKTIAENSTDVIGRFSITGETGATFVPAAGSAFAIDANQDLRLSSPGANHEANTSMNVNVTATVDGVTSSAKAFSITITDVNEGPHSITVGGEASPYALTVDEGETGNWTLNSIDPESDTVTYTTSDAAFTITGTTLSLASGAAYGTEYTTTVTATDNGNPMESTTTSTITVTVNRTEDNVAPTIALSTQTPATIDERETSKTFNFTSTDTHFDARTWTLRDHGADTDYTAGLFSIASQSNTTCAVTLNLGNATAAVGSTYTVRVHIEEDSTTAALPGGGPLSHDYDLTVTVNNVNDTPTAVAISANTIAENSLANTVIGDLSTTDPDLNFAGNNESHTYTIQSQSAEEYFKIGGANDDQLLLAKQAPDYDTMGTDKTLTVTIQTQDAAGSTHDQALTITVTDVNEAPSQPQFVREQTHPTAIDENNVETVVGTFERSTDPEGAQIVYRLTSGADHFTINASTGVLSVLANRNYEDTPTISATVVADDSNVSATRMTSPPSATVEITINDVHEAMAAPTYDAGQFAQSLDEHNIDEVQVGTFSATDPDEDTITFHLADETHFRIGADSGELFVKAGRNFDGGNSPTGDTITATVYARAGGDNSATTTVDITINNVDDKPTLSYASVATDVAEKGQTRTHVGTFTVADEDSADTPVLTITGDDANHFELQGNALYVKANQDRETHASLTISVTAEVQGRLSSDAVDITITISDVDEFAPAPITVSYLAGTTITGIRYLSEGTGIQELAALVSSDDDATHSVTFTVNDTVNFDIDTYSLDGSTPVLRAITPRRFGTNYPNVVVTATSYVDGTTTAVGTPATTTLAFSITDTVNDTPTAINLSTEIFPETLAAGGTIADLSVVETDEAPFGGYTFTLAGDDSAKFALGGSAGARTLTLKDALAYDAATPANNEFSITLAAADPAGNSTGALPFTIVMEREAPTVTIQHSLDIAENAASDASPVVLGTIVSNYPGTMVPSNTVNFDVNNTVNPPELRFIGGVDFDADNAEQAPKSASTMVRVEHSGGILSAPSAIVTVNVTDANDEIPTISIAGGESASQAVDEDTNMNTISWSLSAADADVAGTTFAWEFVGDANDFTMNATTGVNVTVTGPDTFAVQDGAPVSCVVRVLGSGQGVTDLYSTGTTLTITTTNVNDKPGKPAFTQSRGNLSIAENAVTDGNSATYIELGTVQSIDPDTGTATGLTYTVSNTTNFQIVASTLQFIGGADYETIRAVSTTVTATDANGAASDPSDAITVTITDANDTAPTIAIDGGVSATQTQTEHQLMNTVSWTLTASDVDTSPAPSDFTWRLAENSDVFIITTNTATGASITVTGPAAAAEQDGSVSCKVYVSDGTNESVATTLTINTTNVDDPPSAPEFAADARRTVDGSGRVQIAENESGAIVLGTLSGSTDPEGNAVTYVTSDTTNFEIIVDNSSGSPVPTLRFKSTASRDYDTLKATAGALTPFTTITASDGAVSSAGIIVTVSITDHNDQNPTITALPATPHDIDEHVNYNTKTWTLTAADVDTAPSTSTFTWSFVTGQNTHGFTIDNDPATGATITVRGPDTIALQDGAAKTCQVQVSDGVNTSTATTLTFNAVTFVDDKPSNITLSNATVNENSAANTTIGTLTVADDNAATYSFEVTGANASLFHVVGDGSANYPATLKVATGQTIGSREVDATYDISITATPLTPTPPANASDPVDFTITVVGVDEVPGTPNLTRSGSVMTLPNGAAAAIQLEQGSAYTVGALSLAEIDIVGQDAQNHTYTIVSVVDGDDTAVANIFSIANADASASTADLRCDLSTFSVVGKSVNAKLLTATVRVTDAASNVGTDIAVTVQVTSTPTITGTGTAGSVTEDAATTTATGQLVASDLDLNSQLTWSIAKHADTSTSHGTMAITPNTATATVNQAVTATWTYTLTTTDFGSTAGPLTETFVATVTDEDGKQSTQNVAITITLVDDAPVVSAPTTGEVTVGGTETATGTCTATDEEADALSWRVRTSGSNGAFDTSATGTYGTLAIVDTADAPNPITGAWTYTLDTTLDATKELAGSDVEQDVFEVVALGTPAGGGSAKQSAARTITVTVNGENDAPVVDMGTTPLFVAENTAGAVVATLTNGDVTDSDDTAFVFSIGTGGGANNALFEVVGVQADNNRVVSLKFANDLSAVRFTYANGSAPTFGAATDWAAVAATDFALNAYEYFDRLRTIEGQFFELRTNRGRIFEMGALAESDTPAEHSDPSMAITGMAATLLAPAYTAVQEAGAVLKLKPDVTIASDQVGAVASTRTVSIRATDDGDKFGEQTVTITVVNADENPNPPTVPYLPQYAPEHVSGAVVCQLTNMGDPDTHDFLTAEQQYASVTALGSQVAAGQGLDTRAQAVAALDEAIARVIDAATGWTGDKSGVADYLQTRDFTQPAPEPGVDRPVLAGGLQAEAGGALTVTVAMVNEIDAMRDAAERFRIVDTVFLRVKAGLASSTIFEIYNSNLLRVKTDQVAILSSSPYTVVVEALDSTGNTAEKSISVIVTDRNVDPFNVRLLQPANDARYLPTMAENSVFADYANVPVPEKVAGVVVGRVAWDDYDAEDTHTLAVLQQGTQNASTEFEIDANNDLKLKNGVVLPAFNTAESATQASYALTIAVTDNGAPAPLTGTLDVTVHVVNLNEVSAIQITPSGGTTATALSTATLSVDEHEDGAVTLGTLGITDPDVAAGRTLTFALKTGHNAKLSIDGTALKITFTATDKALVGNTYEGTVVVTDTDADGAIAVAEQAFSVTVNNENDAPTDLELTSNAVAENTTAVGTVSVSGHGGSGGTSGDANDTYTFTLVAEDDASTANDNGLFSLTAVAGNPNAATLAFQSAPDFENPQQQGATDNSYRVRVQAADQDGLTFKKHFDITVTPANEAPTAPVLTRDGSNVTSVSMAEDATKPFVLGVLSATDEDAGDTPSFSTETVDFEIDNATSELKYTGAADYEVAAESSLTVTVKALDASDASLFASADFTLNVTDVDDTAPVFGGDVTGAVTEDSSSSVSGDLTLTDVDTTLANVTWSVATYSRTANKYYGAMTLGNTTDNSAEWTYTLNAAAQELAEGATATEVWRVSAETNSAESSTVTQDITITITGTNDGPTAISNNTGRVSGAVGSTSTGTMSATDDSDSTFTYALTNGTGGSEVGTYGTLTLTNANTGAWSYELGNTTALADAYKALDAGDEETDEFDITVADSAGATLDGKITITVTGVNDAAVTAGTVNVLNQSETGDITGDITVTDADESAAHTLAVKATPADNGVGTYGTFTVADANVLRWTYSSNATQQAARSALDAGVSVTDSVVLVVNDGHADTDVTVNLTITGTDNEPVITAATLASSSTSGTVAATDAEGHAITWTAQSNVAGTYGTLTSLSTAGEWAYAVDVNDADYIALASGETATESFSVEATANGQSVSGNLVITVTGIDEAHSITGASTTIAANATDAATGTLAITDEDESYAAPVIVTDDPTNYPKVETYGEFTLSGHVWTYTFKNSAAGALEALPHGTNPTDSMWVKFASSTTDNEVFQQVVVTVQGINDAPVATFDAAQSATEGQATSLTGTLTATDADSNSSVTFAARGDAIPGLTINANGTWTFDLTNAAYDNLKNGETLAVTVGFRATDDQGATDDGEFVVTIIGTNDAPVATYTDAQTATEDGASINGQLTSTDVDKGTATFAAVAPIPAGLTIDADGAWSFDPSNEAYQSLAAGTILDLPVVYEVTDEHGATDQNQFVITVAGANDVPRVVSTTQSARVNENASVTGTFPTASDADATSTLTWAFKNPADGVGEHGTLTITDASTGTWSYAANNDALDEADFVQDVFVLTVTDDQNTTAEVTLTVDVTGTNDAPTITGTLSQTLSADSATSVTGVVSIGDADAGDVAFTPKVCTPPTYGTLAIALNNAPPAMAITVDAASGSFAGLPASMQRGVAYTLTYPATNQPRLSATEDGTHAPGGTASEYTTGVDASAPLTLVITLPFDAPDTLYFYGTSSGMGAAVSVIDPTATWTYNVDTANADVRKLAASESLQDTMEIMVRGDDMAMQTITVTITGVDDAPTITAVQQGAVTEGNAATATGTMHTVDVDSDAQGQWKFRQADGLTQDWSREGTYGTISFPTNNNTSLGAAALNAGADTTWTYTHSATATQAAAVRALAHGQSATDSFTATYNGTDYPITITVHGANSSVSDLSAGGAFLVEGLYETATDLGTLTATDDDTSNTHTFEIEDGDDGAKFEIDGATLKLKAGETVVAGGNLTLTVCVKDFQVVDGVNTEQAHRDFVLTVPVRSFTLGSNSLAENEVGATVGELAIGGAAISPAPGFAVVGASDYEVSTATLKLKAGVAADHETQASPSVQVQATVAGAAGANMVVKKSFTLSVSDRDDAATDIAVTAVSYNENDEGAKIASLSTIDQDRA